MTRHRCLWYAEPEIMAATEQPLRAFCMNRAFRRVSCLQTRHHAYSDGMKNQLAIAENYGVPILTEWEEDADTLIVDAIFGIGLSRQIEGKTADLIRKINEKNVPVVAVDIASGISADNGAVLGCAVKADMTVTFAFKKLGQLLYPGADYTGKLFVCDIGITKKSWLEKKPSYFALEKEDLKKLPKRENRSNKGSYGKVLLIAGSPDMGGAAVFASAGGVCVGLRTGQSSYRGGKPHGAAYQSPGGDPFHLCGKEV